MPARPEAGDEEMEGILYLLQEFKGKVVLFGISDVVDIAIMAFLIYKVIMLMRRTNSGAVAKGVLLLLFALGVSTFFHLNTVSYLLQQLMVWGVVALVVIFQPEIRRFLEQMGRTSLGRCLHRRRHATSWIVPSLRRWMPICPFPRARPAR